jgi:hypothetical protein
MTPRRKPYYTIGRDACHHLRMRMSRPFVRLVDRFEERGVYVPGEDNKAISPWRDFGWLLAGFMLTTAVFVLFFAVAA